MESHRHSWSSTQKQAECFPEVNGPKTKVATSGMQQATRRVAALSAACVGFENTTFTMEVMDGTTTEERTATDCSTLSLMCPTPFNTPMSKLSNPDLKFVVPRQVIRDSLAFFRLKGQLDKEGVVLWPAFVSAGIATISSIIVPRQIATRLSFRIPPGETFPILAQIAEVGMVIPIQVHSHPNEAFHSEADDRWAFVRHSGAISIVVPDFGAIEEREFDGRTAFFRLNSGGVWQEMTKSDVLRRFQFER
jgi:hypothetical protein